MLQEFTEPLPGEVQVRFRSPLRALLECVEYIDGLIELGELDDAMLEVRTHTNFANAEADHWHGLPVVRFEPALNPPELKSRHLSRISREAAQIVSSGPEPEHGLLSHGYSYKYRHTLSSE